VHIGGEAGDAEAALAEHGIDAIFDHLKADCEEEGAAGVGFARLTWLSC
jgi:hypothetical protein